MGQSIAVMNTKGGVGKSTIAMGLAETLSVFHQKNVLVIDSDSQTSMSTMLMDISRWEQIERQHRTLVDYLLKVVLGPGGANWREYIASGVSDVEDAKSIYLIPSHMELSLFEREVSAQKREAELRQAVRGLLAEATRVFDVVVIDCPPGISLLTECWLREAQFFLPPTKPDYLAARGLTVLKNFREKNAEQGFAKLLGVLINMKDGRIGSEEDWHQKLAADPDNRCFQSWVPRRAYIQRAADFDKARRTYIAKYPGDAGQSLRLVVQEMLARLAGVEWQAARPAAAQPAQAQPAEARPPVAAARPAAAEPARPAAAGAAASTPRVAPAAAPPQAKAPAAAPAPRAAVPPAAATAAPASTPAARGGAEEEAPLVLRPLKPLPPAGEERGPSGPEVAGIRPSPGRSLPPAPGLRPLPARPGRPLPVAGSAAPRPSLNGASEPPALPLEAKKAE